METEEYRRETFEPMRNVDFNKFEKVLFLSATATDWDDSKQAMCRLGFRGVLKEDEDARLMDFKTKVINLIDKPPLGHIYKDIIKSNDSPREALELLKSLFALEPHSKAIVAVGRRALVGELAIEWNRYFNILWIHGSLSSEEKTRRTQTFINDGSMRVLIGTKLVSEGIDVKELRMVLIVDYLPQIGEYIQCAGRLRSNGFCSLVLNNDELPSPSQRERDGSMTLGCITSQIRRFYGLSSEGEQ
ncbi:LAFE_0C00144g1_1 [Lachancea fermentati]|uniref:LAFE_0C00144g1_1 n=1 Tax=Lachancea fermentati TaxID=4955 RepID=A0A1G4M972_LACFM|nr:LAFE_0C00144g1_1 [Lachancea fermentati]